MASRSASSCETLFDSATHSPLPLSYLGFVLLRPARILTTTPPVRRAHSVHTPKLPTMHMTLDKLLAELLSLICRELGRPSALPRLGPNGERCCYINKDFQSLRQTCKNIYDRTLYDASIRYAWNLEEYRLKINERNIMTLLNVSKIPT